MVKNNIYLIIHGHFYQPPREEPGTDEIDRQLSAAPFHDWNQRINKECYAANAASRILDSSGRIEDIINNYRYMSFNFGPTLLKWLKRNDPFTYGRILEADKESMAIQNGHGNAIAQVYNHIILPLAGDKDIITEIDWGVRSFQKDFGRDPEGIWLSETAINNHVAEHLISFGIKYVILSPDQAKETKTVQAHHWHSVSLGIIDPSKPYLLNEPNGSLAVFFLYADIARKISFEHLLRNVEYFRGELLSHNKTEQENILIHTATDGESYGHHEPFGDMCLARLIFDNKTFNDFKFTNYGRYLEMFPPQDLVQLKELGEHKGTSWSCPHGVGRWYEDCGCSTGGKAGWNQKWRTLLREAFDYLRDNLYNAAEEKLSSHLENLWEARNEYHRVIYSDSIEERGQAAAVFLKEQTQRNPGSTEGVLVLKVMEALHNALLMYTSCGWFFSDISGIETVQNMKYALKILDLGYDIIPEEIREKFLSMLGQAKSNIPEFENGRWIFEKMVKKTFFYEEQAVMECLLNTVLTGRKIKPLQKMKKYFYEITFSFFQRMVKKDFEFYKSIIRIINIFLSEEKQYIIYLIQKGIEYYFFIKQTDDNSLTGYLDRIIEKKNGNDILRYFTEWFGESCTLKNFPYDVREHILKKIFEDAMLCLHKNNDKALSRIEDYLSAVRLYRELGIRMPGNDLAAVEEYFNEIILTELGKLEGFDIDSYDFSYLTCIIQTIQQSDITIDYADILPYIRNYILKRMNEAIIKQNVRELKHIERVIDFTNFAGIDFEKYEIQNLLYIELSNLVSEQTKKKASDFVIEFLLRIASKFNIVIFQFEEKLRNRQG